MNLGVRLRNFVKRAARPASLLRSISEPLDELTRLADRFGTDKGTSYASRHHYTRVYSEYLEPLRDRRVRLLELGLLHIAGGWDAPERRDSGGALGSDAPSLRMWAAYFRCGDIFGFDLNDFSHVQIPRCRIFRGNMGRREDLAAMVSQSGGDFDVIVDDASHASHHQQIALGALFPALKRGGLYFIEDLAFQRPSLEVPDALKTVDFLRRAEVTRQFHSPFLTPGELAYLDENVDSVALFDTLAPRAVIAGRDSLGVIRKGA